MKNKYIAPEFEDINLLSPAIMDVITENGTLPSIDFTDDSHLIEEEDPFSSDN